MTAQEAVKRNEKAQGLRVWQVDDTPSSRRSRLSRSRAPRRSVAPPLGPGQASRRSRIPVSGSGTGPSSLPHCIAEPGITSLPPHARRSAPVLHQNGRETIRGAHRGPRIRQRFYRVWHNREGKVSGKKRFFCGRQKYFSEMFSCDSFVLLVCCGKGRVISGCTERFLDSVPAMPITTRINHRDRQGYRITKRRSGETGEADAWRCCVKTGLIIPGLPNGVGAARDNVRKRTRLHLPFDVR